MFFMDLIKQLVGYVIVLDINSRQMTQIIAQNP